MSVRESGSPLRANNALSVVDQFFKRLRLMKREKGTRENVGGANLRDVSRSSFAGVFFVHVVWRGGAAAGRCTHLVRSWAGEEEEATVHVCNGNLIRM